MDYKRDSESGKSTGTHLLFRVIVVTVEYISKPRIARTGDANENLIAEPVCTQFIDAKMQRANFIDEIFSTLFVRFHLF